MEITVKTDNKKIYNLLLRVVKGLGLQTKTKSTTDKTTKKYEYPLAGSVLKYEDPFEPACDDWEVLK